MSPFSNNARFSYGERSPPYDSEILQAASALSLSRAPDQKNAIRRQVSQSGKAACCRAFLSRRSGPHHVGATSPNGHQCPSCAFLLVTSRSSRALSRHHTPARPSQRPRRFQTDRAGQSHRTHHRAPRRLAARMRCLSDVLSSRCCAPSVSNCTTFLRRTPSPRMARLARPPLTGTNETWSTRRPSLLPNPRSCRCKICVVRSVGARDHGIPLYRSIDRVAL
jgi:hypothetical protein